MQAPSLVVVGTGIRVVGQMTTETIAWIQLCDKVLYLVSDPVAAEAIRQLNAAGCESLATFYVDGKSRRQSIQEMVARVMDCVCSGARTCLAILGHPGVFTLLGHEAVRQARLRGYSAQMLPAVSAEDCLFADLGLDPATSGCQSYEAMDFLKNGRRSDPSSLLILWQVGVMGDPVHRSNGYDLFPLPLLVERLCRDYGEDHEVIVYEAAVTWGASPVVDRLPLGRLPSARLSPKSTLCIPPGEPTRPDSEVLRRLNLIRPTVPA